MQFGLLFNRGLRAVLRKIGQRLLHAMLLVVMLCPAVGRAHKLSDAYLQFTPTSKGWHVRWDIALRDLDMALALDRNDDKQLSWGEIREQTATLDRYALSALTIADGTCRPQQLDHALAKRSDGTYWVLSFETPCLIGDTLALDYRLFAHIDPTHRAIVQIARAAAPDTPAEPAGMTAIYVLDPNQGATVLAVHPRQTTEKAEAADRGSSMVKEGIHHILVGYDHMLFLLCLLFPAVLRRESSRWQPVASWREAWLPVLATVTAFTLAHSITLALAALEWIVLPPRLIESAIALTICFAALRNLWQANRRHTLWMALGFGLIHGFGFANVLRELSLPVTGFIWALFQFNLGVEIGQLMIVMLALSLLYLTRHQRWYYPVVQVGGSLGACLLASVWLVERVFDLRILPF